jgi:hypothetical protein
VDSKRFNYLFEEDIQMKQRDAVYSAITSTLEDAGISFEDGMDVSTVLTPELRKSAHAIVTEGFTSGKIAFESNASNNEKLANPAKLNSYVSGLISNWVRKDKRLNGDVSYVAKNPGSRVGSGDEQVKTLRALFRKFSKTDPTKAASVQTFIDQRIAALKSEKGSSMTITEEQLASIPAELRESLGL